jgi:hypothetical protein
MNEITRDIILDLLPLYLAGEVSEDTSNLVKKYLAEHPELAEIARQGANSLNTIPIPYSKEIMMEKFEEKKWSTIRTLGLAAIGALLFMCFFLSIAIGSSVESWASRL